MNQQETQPKKSKTFKVLMRLHTYRIDKMRRYRNSSAATDVTVEFPNKITIGQMEERLSETAIFIMDMNGHNRMSIQSIQIPVV